MASAVITSKSQSALVRAATACAYGIFSIVQPPPPTVLITETLPFRIRFTNIGIPSYTVSDVPPIGIAIVGLNNYIL